MKLDERSRRALLAGVLVLAAVSAYRYYADVDADTAHEPAAQSPPVPAGWDALDQCGGEFDSFTEEGTVLSLKFDGTALVTKNYDDADRKKEHKGEWTYDGQGYALAIEGKTTSYTLLRTLDVCALINGSPEVANLRESWVGTTNEDAPEE
jgi:hypothetical protein